MCKLMKADSPILAWLLEFEYVNEVAARESVAPPDVRIPARVRVQGTEPD